MERISERAKLEPVRKRENHSIHAVSDLRNPRKTRAKREWVRPRGIEPRLRDPQSRVLSVERRAQNQPDLTLIYPSATILAM